MKTTSELRADLNRTQYDTLVADGELALTFVRLAAASSDTKVRNRRLACAIEACELMSRRMPHLDLDEQQVRTLTELHAQLVSSIAALEY